LQWGPEAAIVDWASPLLPRARALILPDTLVLSLLAISLRFCLISFLDARSVWLACSRSLASRYTIILSWWQSEFLVFARELLDHLARFGKIWQDVC
jgi:hypothetical protein